MTILGVIVRARPADARSVGDRLAALAGVEVAQVPHPGDPRAVIVIEDSAGSTAAAQLGAIAGWPDVLGVSLVYEYSGPDSPAPDDVEAFRDWRRSLAKPPQGGSGDR